MRSVNLIPPEEQGVGSGRGPLRTGLAPYIIVGALALALVMVIAMAVTSKQIDDQTAKKATLESDLASATARANSLRSFSDFRDVQEARAQTVSSLAQSRFDWERVLRELSLVIPDDVWLVKLNGTVSPAVTLPESTEIQIRSTIPGPALTIVGCAPTQDGVAGFVAALEDIDGVTRVGVGSSSRTDEAASTSGDGQETNEECRTSPTIYKFEIAIAFDAVPTPPAATPAPAVPEPAPSTSPQGQLAEAPPAGAAADVTPGVGG